MMISPTLLVSDPRSPDDIGLTSRITPRAKYEMPKRGCHCTTSAASRGLDGTPGRTITHINIRRSNTTVANASRMGHGFLAGQLARYATTETSEISQIKS